MSWEQVSNAVTFVAFFVESKVGKAGLTVTVDVYAPDGTQLVTAGSAAEVGGGAYKYELGSGSTGSAGEYLAIFKTATSTVDQQHIPSLWVVGRAGVEHLDAPISTVDAVVDAILADTGTDGVVVASASRSGYSLASTGLDAIVPAEPAGVPAWGSSTVVQWLAWLGLFGRNKLTQTSSTAAIRNDADDASIATSATSDDGTTYTRGEWT